MSEVSSPAFKSLKDVYIDLDEAFRVQPVVLDVL